MAQALRLAHSRVFLLRQIDISPASTAETRNQPLLDIYSTAPLLPAELDLFDL
jgi:hypothetical protein